MKDSNYNFDSGREYTPLPPEFREEQAPPKKKKTKKEGKDKLRRYLLMLPALAASAVISVSGGSSPQPPSPQPPPSPVKQEYPVEQGTLYLSVYADILDWDETDDRSMTLLVREELDIARFAEGYTYELPAHPTAEDYTFVGWVMGAVPEEYAFEGLFVTDDRVTAEDLGRIKPTNDAGDRTVEIHAAWRGPFWEVDDGMLILSANGGDIEGKASKSYNVSGPMYSGSVAYLCAYPVPEREGYTFGGWYYDEYDTTVEMLWVDDFHEMVEDEWGLRPDWSQPKSIQLEAVWIKN